MSTGITHELNQPLTALRTLSSNTIVFLQRDQRDKVEANLQMIAHLTDHMGKITAQLKKFARKSAPLLQPVVLSSIVADALFLLTQGARAPNVRIEQDIAPEGLRVMCDANRLEQVLLNLLSNAVDAVADGAAPNVLVSARPAPGELVCIEVHDNGPGVSDAALSHLFEPFFSTKDQGVGLGLGLAISADIVRDLGGSLRAGTSDALGGAVFTVTLKAVVAEAAYA
jgi:two-component system C4-dicarboxylate transport sensor histidine kinase DctB